MLFVSSAPIQTKILEDGKVIILTAAKIMFTQLEFFEEYLVMPLITKQPTKMYHEPSIMQTVVVSNTTVEVYYCDWKTQVKLIKVIILNNESVDSVCYEKGSGWHVFGSMSQYQPARISFHRNDDRELNTIARCYVDRNKYIVTKQKFFKCEGLNDPKEVWWKDRMMILRNSNFEIMLAGNKSLDGKKDFICINSTYLLIVSRFEVLATIVEPTIVYTENNLMISCIEKGNLVMIQKYQSSSFSELGIIQKDAGQLCAAFLFEENLIMLQYDQKQIHVNTLPLTTEEDKSTQRKNEKRKRLFQSISRIMEQSHEQGSQFIPRDEKMQSKKQSEQEVAEKKSFHYHPHQKPKIRDIVIDNDEQINSNPRNEDNSQVLSRSGLEGDRQSYTNTDPEEGSAGANHQISFQRNHSKGSMGKVDHNSYSVPTKIARQISEKAKSDNVTSKQKEKDKIKKNKAEIDDLQSQQKSNYSGSSRKRDKPNRSISINKHENDHSFEQYAATPGFGLDILGNDKWGEFDKQWNQAADQINEESEEDLQQSVCIQDQKSVLKFMPENISKKVQAFRPSSGILTTEIYNKIQKASYCSLISKAIEQDPDKMQELMNQFLPNLLQQSEAPLFFQKNIRTFNPQFTQDKIRSLFKSIIGKKEYNQKITSALQLFKISQVPKQVICFPPDFIKVVSTICKQIYIQDLLKPSESTVDYMLNSYFSIENFSQDVITIEDQQIDITHPRNMLNILLYLNEFFKLKIESIIKVYCSKLVDENHLEVLKKIIFKQNIFQICEVPRSVLDDIIVDKINSLLRQSTQNADYLWELIQFLSKSLMDQNRIRIAIICQLNKCNLVFDLQSFIVMKTAHTDIYLFIQKIINQNSARNLLNFKLGSIYRSLYWLQQDNKVAFVTNEFVELAESLAQKFCQKKYFAKAFQILDTVLPKVRMSFVAKMLMLHLKYKFLNRIGENPKPISLKTLFPELTASQDIDAGSLPHDKVKIPSSSKSLSCSWSQFVSIFDKYLEGPIELKVLIYCEINIAYELFLGLDENKKQKFTKFITEIEPSLTVQLNDMNQIDDSLNPKGLTGIRFEQYIQSDHESQGQTSTINREDVLLPQQQNKNKKIVYKSMTLIDHFNNVNQSKLVRRNSDKKCSSEDQQNKEDILRIKLLVSEKQIIDQLRDIYSTKEQHLFLRALKFVDQQKAKLYHLEVFKAILYKQVQYPLSRIIPFEVFLTMDLKDAFELTRDKITIQINFKNFWVILAVIELMFRKGTEVCQILIRKCILYLRNDNCMELIKIILDTLKPKFTNAFIQEMVQYSKGYGLKAISALLSKYVVQNGVNH